MAAIAIACVQLSPVDMKGKTVQLRFVRYYQSRLRHDDLSV
jgi:hypothetical protein